MKLPELVMDYIKAHKDEAYELLLELAQIPAPSNHEEKRANFCYNWLIAQGAKDVKIDEALNVILSVGCTDDNPLVVFEAHSDVVFPDTDKLPLEIKDGKITCPGIGDDTANAVAMLMAAKYVIENNIQPKDYGMLIIVNAGEEGLGNLKGTRKIMADYGHRVKEFYSFDSWNRRVASRSVGSKRYRVEIKTEGGHSYHAFGNRNAIHYIASLIDTLYTMKVPTRGKTTYNVGLVSGGTSVNTIAQQAEVCYEFRSDSAEDLAEMDKHFESAIEFYRNKGLEVNVELLGERPCMGDVDMAHQQKLIDRAIDATTSHFGGEATCEASSTDCNIPLSMGIPAVTVGCFIGGGAHTRSEYLEIDSLFAGLCVAFDMILYYC